MFLDANTKTVIDTLKRTKLWPKGQGWKNKRNYSCIGTGMELNSKIKTVMYHTKNVSFDLGILFQSGKLTFSICFGTDTGTNVIFVPVKYKNKITSLNMLFRY